MEILFLWKDPLPTKHIRKPVSPSCFNKMYSQPNRPLFSQSIWSVDFYATGSSSSNIKSIVCCMSQLTPRKRDILEKLTVDQLFMKFPAFHHTQRFTTIFTSALFIIHSFTVVNYRRCSWYFWPFQNKKRYNYMLTQSCSLLQAFHDILQATVPAHDQWGLFLVSVRQQEPGLQPAGSQQLGGLHHSAAPHTVLLEAAAGPHPIIWQRGLWN